jgi:hypothetical protein
MRFFFEYAEFYNYSQILDLSVLFRAINICPFRRIKGCALLTKELMQIPLFSTEKRDDWKKEIPPRDNQENIIFPKLRVLGNYGKNFAFFEMWE